MPDGPRRHHYLFAHRELPSAAFRFGANLAAASRDGRLTLDNAWNHLGQTLPEAERLAADSLGVSNHRLDAHDIVVVTLPPPQHPAEAYLAAIAVSDGDAEVRYFTLEDARSPVDGLRYTVLAEWTNDGKHINYGPGPDADPPSLVAAIAPHLTDSVP